MRPNPRARPRSACTAWAYLISPIAVENCGFSNCGGQAGHCLGVRDMRGHFENFFREIIDAIEKTASAGDENTVAEVIDEWFFIEPAFE